MGRPFEEVRLSGRVQIFDVDEVILRFDEAFIDFVNSETGSDAKFDDFVEWDLVKCLGMPHRKVVDLYKRFVFSDRIGSLGYYEDAVEYINSLEGVEVVLMTALESTPHTRRMRERNLRRVRYDSIVYSSDKARKASALRPEMVVDDKPATVMEYLAERGRIGAIGVPRRPWTRGLERELSGVDSVKFYDRMTELHGLSSLRNHR